AGIAGRCHVAQRPLSVAGPARGAARGDPGAASRWARRAPRAAGGPPRYGLRARPGPAVAALGSHRRVLAGDERPVRPFDAGVALARTRVRGPAGTARRRDPRRAWLARSGGEAVRILHFSDPHV